MSDRWPLVSLLVWGSWVCACGGSPEIPFDGNKDGGSATGGTTSSGGDGNIDIPLGGAMNGTGGEGWGEIDLDTLTIVYEGPDVIVITDGEELPRVTFSATLEGKPFTVGWSVDRGEIGSISSEGVFVPTGKVGGAVTIRAGVNDKIVTKTIFVSIRATQNGPSAAQTDQVATSVAQLIAGGGIGGVGGEGLGVGVTDPAVLDALASPSSDGSAEHLTLLYPYQGTIFPRGVLAPLLMWSWDTNDADAVRLRLATKSGSYEWQGTFGRPAILADSGGAFIRHPIPQDVWASATQSAGESLEDGTSDTLQLELVVYRAGQAYGPLTRTFGVAPGKLTGVVYYNSYGTNLVTNTGDILDFNDQPFGAAVLGIRSGETAPVVVSGPASSDDTGCRVCHTVSAQGTHLLVQGGGDDRMSWWRELLGDDEQYLTGQDSTFAWAGLSPDGRFALTNAVDASRHNRTVGPDDLQYSALYDMTAAPPSRIDDAELPAQFKAALPAFSPDGKQVAFAYLGGAGGGVPEGLPVDGSRLAVMDFDPAARKFSNFRVVAVDTLPSPPPSNYLSHGIGWPSFTPGGAGLVYQREVRGAHTNETYIGTRDEARGELWWTSNQHPDHATLLGYLNGKNSEGMSYLPVGPQRHGTDDGSYDDTTLQYEPTVNPIATGGYVWVVFTSRRLYGNLAVSDPWLSDPRDYDATDPDLITTKKLWVAALRVDAAPGEDPSYPAFYLPAQELVAGNARGYWVLDPCKEDGVSCETGDQCCGGYCQPNGEGGALVCSDKTTTSSCAAEQEKCEAASDCCNPGASCINGFCARPAPPVPR